MVMTSHRNVIMSSYPPNQKLRQARKNLRLSQDEFAELLGAHMRDQMGLNVSPSGNLVGMWERGEVRPGRVYRRGLCDFTGLSGTELGLRPETPVLIRGHALVPAQDGPDGSCGATVVRRREYEDGDDPVRRREMLAGTAALAGTAMLGRVARPGGAAPRSDGRVLDDVLFGGSKMTAPVSLPALRTRLDASREDFRNARYGRLPVALPGLLAAADATAGNAACSDLPAAKGLLAETYILAADWAVKLNDDPLSWTAADRALETAQSGGDALTLADARRAVATAMRRSGHADRACDLLLRACRDIDPKTPDELAMYGSLLNVAAYTAATGGNRGAAEDYIGEAEEAARRMGTAASTRQPAFSAAGVTLYQVSIAQVLGNSETAIEHARTLTADDFPTPEREGRYWVDVARAFHQWGKPDPCYSALLAAERAAPAEVRYRPPVHRMTEDLLRASAPMPGLRGFAQRIGIPDA